MPGDVPPSLGGNLTRGAREQPTGILATRRARSSGGAPAARSAGALLAAAAAAALLL